MYIVIYIIFLFLIFSVSSNYDPTNRFLLDKHLIGSWRVIGYLYDSNHDDSESKIESTNIDYYFFKNKKGLIVQNSNIIKRFSWKIDKEILTMKGLNKNQRKDVIFKLRFYKDIPHKLIFFENNENLKIQIILNKNLSLKLYNSIINNDKKKVVDLVNIGVSLNIKYKSDNTPLHISVIRGNNDISMFIIERLGINSIYIKNNDGKTPLDIAKEKNYSTLVSLFKEQDNIYQSKLYKKQNIIIPKKAKIYRKVYKITKKTVKKVKQASTEYSILTTEDRPKTMTKIKKRKKDLEIISKTN